MKITWKIFTLVCLLLLATLYWIDLRRANATTSQTHTSYEVSDPSIPKISVPIYTLHPKVKTPIRYQELNSLQGLEIFLTSNEGDIIDPLFSDGVNGGMTPGPLLTFEGLGTDGIAPPDPVGDVGLNHYVQMVNVSLQIWDKGDPENGVHPSIIQPDTPFNQLFMGFGGPCENQNDGNPIVLYDDQADRWLLSQFVLGEAQSLCVAVSTSPDPTATYYLYEFPMPGPSLDAPKLAAWSDAYYVGTSSGVPNGYNAHALERIQMLAGLPASRQSYLDLANFVMPADADGLIQPPVGEPGIFYTMYAEGFELHPPGIDRLALYEFYVDWSIPDNSSFTLVSEIPIPDFNYTVCGFSFASEGCIPQPNTTQTLDARSNWPMFRFQYRNFGNFASLVGNFTVDANGENKAAIRWFELRKNEDIYSLYQEGTYAPDADHRWTGSIAMDASGNLAVGYNVSSETTIPSIRYATRLVTDPPGTLAAETVLWIGSGVQTGIARWGDYSTLVVDPVDGCHFWFTAQYHDENDSGFNWNTRIGVFKIPTCGGNTGTLTGQVTDGTNGLPNVHIQAHAFITQTGTTTTVENGSYALSLSEGTYVVTATAYGYLPGAATGVEIISGTTTLQNFELLPAPTYLITGTVYDARAGWPLYAKISINDYPGNPIWTNPETGEYQIFLPEGNYTFEVSAWNEGYLLHNVEASIENNLTLDFPMEVNADTCNAPGYVFNGTIQSFDEETIPSGWETVDNINLSNPQVWLFNDPAGRGNLTGGAGPFAIIDSDYYGELGVQDTSLISPPLDFSALTNVSLAFDTDFKVWEGNTTNEQADVDISTDGGETWINAWHQEMQDGNYNGHVTLDISQIVANEPEVLLQFRYYNASYDYWWQMDNIAYGSLTCDPIPGGLIIGNAYDANFNSSLNEASVNIPLVISTTTQPTPDDPLVEDGFFSLFAPQGTYTLTATFPNYGNPLYPLTVVTGTTIRQDLFLPAGWVNPDPDSISLSLGFGYSATLPLRLQNLGGMSVTVNLSDKYDFSTNTSWLTITPLTGTLPANTSLDGQLLFATSSLTETGIYSTNLIIENDTPYGNIIVPISLTVGPPAPSVNTTPNQTGRGAPGITLQYTVAITNTGNVPDGFIITADENSWITTSTLTTTFLNPGTVVIFEVFVTIPAHAQHQESNTIAFVVAGIDSGVSATFKLKSIAQFPFVRFLPLINH